MAVRLRCGAGETRPHPHAAAGAGAGAEAEAGQAEWMCGAVAIEGHSIRRRSRKSRGDSFVCQEQEETESRLSAPTPPCVSLVSALEWPCCLRGAWWCGMWMYARVLPLIASAPAPAAACPKVARRRLSGPVLPMCSQAGSCTHPCTFLSRPSEAWHRFACLGATSACCAETRHARQGNKRRGEERRGEVR